MKRKSAIIPIRMHNEVPQVLIIRNAANNKWIIPKGTIDAPLNPYVSAIKEAYEEAGVLGRPHPVMVGTYFRNNQEIPTYILDVDVELKSYEEDKRDRRWCTEGELPTYIVEEDLLEILIIGLKIYKSRGYYFKYVVATFCHESKLNYSKITKKKASIYFELADKNIQKVYIYRYGSTLEFVAPSKVKFKELKEVPHDMAAQFLYENSEKKIGFWCIEKFEEEFYFTRMYNIELKVLSCDFFLNILSSLATQCYGFEKELKNKQKLALPQNSNKSDKQ